MTPQGLVLAAYLGASLAELIARAVVTRIERGHALAFDEAVARGKAHVEATARGEDGPT